MKKYFTSIRFKRYNEARALNRLKRRIISDSKRKANNRVKSENRHNDSENPDISIRVSNKRLKNKPFVFAPQDLRLTENTEGSLAFFRDLRSEQNLNIRGLHRFITMSLKYVDEIDYATISVLTAINDEFRFKGIILRTILPDRIEPKQFMIDSGYLNNLFDENGRRFQKSDKSELIFFEKGSGLLSEDDNRKISIMLQHVVSHLQCKKECAQRIKTVILEICGNSIEWSGTENKQWLLGVKYESEKVVFTVTDIGKGILDTLYRKFSKRFFEPFKSSDQILTGAFTQKYGSTSREVNRNKGLPAIKTSLTNGAIKNLKVLTNNVILHFNDESLSRTFKPGSPRFKGTFYQWEMDSSCLL